MTSNQTKQKEGDKPKANLPYFKNQTPPTRSEKFTTLYSPPINHPSTA